MDQDINELIKHREIRFRTFNPHLKQAYSATLLLNGLDGIHRVHPASDDILQVSYDVTLLTLKLLEDALYEVGFHLDNSLMSKFKRALYYYTEETQRANLGIDEEAGTNMQVFINRYQKLRHGCRDDRPAHWRAYR
jgi:hypothetical protein